MEGLQLSMYGIRRLDVRELLRYGASMNITIAGGRALTEADTLGLLDGWFGVMATGA